MMTFVVLCQSQQLKQKMSDLGEYKMEEVRDSVRSICEVLFFLSIVIIIKDNRN